MFALPVPFHPAGIGVQISAFSPEKYADGQLVQLADPEELA